MTAAVKPMTIESSDALKDRTADMMGLLKQMDLSDRNYLTWFQEFSDALDAYNTEIGADQDLYCSKPDYLLRQRLSPMLDKISLVVL